MQAAKEAVLSYGTTDVEYREEERTTNGNETAYIENYGGQTMVEATINVGMHQDNPLTFISFGDQHFKYMNEQDHENPEIMYAYYKRGYSVNPLDKHYQSKQRMMEYASLYDYTMSVGDPANFWYNSNTLNPGYAQHRGSKAVFEVLYNSGDVIKGVFHGHIHADMLTVEGNNISVELDVDKSNTSVTLLMTGPDYSYSDFYATQDKSKLKYINQLNISDGKLSFEFKTRVESGQNMLAVLDKESNVIFNDEFIIEDDGYNAFTTTRTAPWMVNWHLTTSSQLENGYAGGECGQMVFSIAISPANERNVLMGTDTGVFTKVMTVVQAGIPQDANFWYTV